MQQQSSQVLFCDECGLANDSTAEQCSFCQHSLARPGDAQYIPPPTPVVIAPPTVLEVTAGERLTGHLSVAGPSALCDFRPGSTLAGHYQIREEIGRGGFSTVYRAVDMSAYQREVAIKRVQLSRLTPSQADEATATLNREITMLARFKGLQGFPLFYELVTDEDNWCLVTQYISGLTLDDYLHKAPGHYLAEQEVVELGLKLVDLVQTLHAMHPPVIFRDLKPENIMITSDKKCYLIDFGIARTFAPGKTRDTIPLGSPGYAAPEQYGRSQTDQRSDIYSLGATLQTLLTGRDPLDLRAGEPSRNPQAPSHQLRKLLDEMLSAEASRRPFHMERVKQRLKLVWYRPDRLLVNGAIVGGVAALVTSVLFFLFFFLSSQQTFLSLDFVFFYASIFVASIVEAKLPARFRIPEQTNKGVNKLIWFAGVLIGASPFILILILWNIFLH
jgi:serine/threonine protein kinase